MSQAIVFSTLGLALVLFVWGRVRHDFVALIALFIVTLAGIVPAADAFLGFGHPAVVTVAAVLIIGQVMERSGVVDLLGKLMSGVGKNFLLQLVSLCLITAAASAVMNNVGALAILMPVAIHLAKKGGHPPSHVLMPIAFASLLGGMTTLIGTPPNIIVATIRADASGEAFGMFHFTPVGLALAVVGVGFIALLGWRLIPYRAARQSAEELFQIEDYITEVKVTRDSKVKGMTIGELMSSDESGVTILGMVRQRQRIHAPSAEEVLKVNDVLILETDTDDLKDFLKFSGTNLVGGRKFRSDARGSKEIELAEAVIMSDSPLIGETAAGLSMRTRFGLNLLALARKGARFRKRIDEVTLRAGDVVLLQGRSHMLHDTIKTMKCLPLAGRELALASARKLVPCLGIFGLSIVAVVTGFLPVQIAFAAAAVVYVLVGLLPLKEVYVAVDWPVIVLLGAMIPVGQALETTGGAELIASRISLLGQGWPPWAVVTLILVVTMFLSDIINNAATVVLMAPIAISVAAGMGASMDPFLMAVAIGGSCAFLTPIGHQSNTLVMGPGGYRFTDYWRMGLPLEALIVAVGVPLIMIFWPL